MDSWLVLVVGGSGLIGNNMDLKDTLDAMTAQNRQEAMKESEQLTLGELTLLFENVDDATKPVVFDDGEYAPESLGSWRGSYRELAIRYGDNGVDGGEFIGMLREAEGNVYIGYKGGEFMMGTTTPIWVANRGESSGFKWGRQGVVDVEETDEAIVIVTDEVPHHDL